MGSRLYVGNLSYSTTEDKLRAAFEPYGTVASATVMLDRMSGRSRGFGFVEFADEADAKKAIEALNGVDVDGRALTVNEARAREEGARGGGRSSGGASAGGRDFGGGSASAGRGSGGPRPFRGGGDRPPENRDFSADRSAARGGDHGGDRSGRGRRGGDRDRRRHDDNDW